MWIITIDCILGVFINLISRNKKERMLMAPVAFILGVIFLLTTVN